ncbi:hypothetical protein GS501_04885 [Saccharibacter sp. 17.LH.SD]|uniref:hypothetical protein n=1 Tax=Saccharibacter sp. 17.LH.SD TaxID=2689393 RepID=UPI0013720823|nr:hypothetical protein [Saccharibacter sp. 17.LH.SD]MXV44382.1 hypothetical protein [Saccharibacter sp. 17.LH.SD]
MKKSDTAAVFPIPFGAQADGSLETYPIPVNTEEKGRVSILKGFPVENFTPISSGGIPPAGADFNGLFRTLSEAIRASESGVIRPYNAAYAQEIGGYPQSALVSDPANPIRLFISTIDDNLANATNDNSGAWFSLSDSTAAAINNESQNRNAALQSLHNQIDAELGNKVSRSGDTMTGDLNLQGNIQGNNYYGRTVNSNVPGSQAAASLQLLGNIGAEKAALSVTGNDGKKHSWFFGSDESITTSDGGLVPTLQGTGRGGDQVFWVQTKHDIWIPFPTPFANFALDSNGNGNICVFITPSPVWGDGNDNDNNSVVATVNRKNNQVVDMDGTGFRARINHFYTGHGPDGYEDSLDNMTWFMVRAVSI